MLQQQPTWNPNLSDLIREWAAKAQLWSLLHSEASRRYNKWARLLGTPLIILNTITTSSLFINLAVDDNRLILVTAIIQCIATILAALNQFLKLGFMATEHEKAGTTAANLAEEISYQLALPAEQRLEVQLFITKIRATLSLVRDKPPVSESVLQKYGKLFDLQTQVPASPVAAPAPSLEFFSPSGSRPHVLRLENQVHRDQIAEFHAAQLNRLNTLLETTLKPS